MDFSAVDIHLIGETYLVIAILVVVPGMFFIAALHRLQRAPHVAFALRVIGLALSCFSVPVLALMLWP